MLSGMVFFGYRQLIFEATTLATLRLTGVFHSCFFHGSIIKNTTTNPSEKLIRNGAMLLMNALSIN